MNKMNEVAKLLGVKLGEEFEIAGSNVNPYILTNEGLFDREKDIRGLMFQKLLTGEVEIAKPLLTKEEKEYFEYVLRPYKDRVEYMGLNHNNYGRWVKIKLVGEAINFPNIRNTDTLQCIGLEDYKAYTLEELGLFEGEES